MSNISVTFKGYWRESYASSIPAKSGIYVVYEGTYNREAKTVDLHKVIYIGESTDVRSRIAGHEKWPKWRQHCGANKVICFSFAPVVNPDRERGEAALIYKHKPPVNEAYKYSFPYETTSMNLKGDTALLEETFTVYSSTLQRSRVHF